MEVHWVSPFLSLRDYFCKFILGTSIYINLPIFFPYLETQSIWFQTSNFILWCVINCILKHSLKNLRFCGVFVWFGCFVCGVNGVGLGLLLLFRVCSLFTPGDAQELSQDPPHMSERFNPSTISPTLWWKDSISFLNSFSIWPVLVYLRKLMQLILYQQFLSFVMPFTFYEMLSLSGARVDTLWPGVFTLNFERTFYQSLGSIYLKTSKPLFLVTVQLPYCWECWETCLCVSICALNSDA